MVAKVGALLPIKEIGPDGRSSIGLPLLLTNEGVSLLGILNANRKIRKRTDTDVAFTREYSRVSIFHRERKCTN